MFESSAKSKLNNREDVYDKSLIYSKNEIGPNMERCGTPQFMYCSSDDIPLWSTYWNRLDK